MVYRTVTEKFSSQKLCARWVLKMLTDIHKNQGVASTHAFLDHCKRGDEIFSHTVSGDETCTLYANADSKQ